MRFASADIAREGRTVQQTREPFLPFPLPRNQQYVRLIYLIRSSKADHDMAIVASSSLTTLDVFTRQLKANAGICNSDTKVFCSWVPTGIALMPE
ncbi:MAG: hypothetical protein ACJ74Y_16705 [Bryobacteraceae bacterium]